LLLEAIGSEKPQWLSVSAAGASSIEVSLPRYITPPKGQRLEGGPLNVKVLDTRIHGRNPVVRTSISMMNGMKAASNRVVKILLLWTQARTDSFLPGVAVPRGLFP
jgi:hypothetical protein